MNVWWIAKSQIATVGIGGRKRVGIFAIRAVDTTSRTPKPLWLDVAVVLDDPFAQELVDAANEYEQRVRFGSMFPYAFTTGAHIAPVLIDRQWRWIVTNFEDDTFVDSKCRNPNEYADTQEGLVDPE